MNLCCISPLQCCSNPRPLCKLQRCSIRTKNALPNTPIRHACCFETLRTERRARVKSPDTRKSQQACALDPSTDWRELVFIGESGWTQTTSRATPHDIPGCISYTRKRIQHDKYLQLTRSKIQVTDPAH